MDIITKRPEGMSFEVYRDLLKISQKKVKRYLQSGRIVHISWRKEKVPMPSANGVKLEKEIIARNPKPFVGDTKKLKFI